MFTIKYMTERIEFVVCLLLDTEKSFAGNMVGNNKTTPPTSGLPDTDVVSDKSDCYPIGYCIPQSISLLLIYDRMKILS